VFVLAAASNDDELPPSPPATYPPQPARAGDRLRAIDGAFAEMGGRGAGDRLIDNEGPKSDLCGFWDETEDGDFLWVFDIDD
jgi:hypothetical protein